MYQFHILTTEKHSQDLFFFFFLRIMNRKGIPTMVYWHLIFGGKWLQLFDYTRDLTNKLIVPHSGTRTQLLAFNTQHLF